MKDKIIEIIGLEPELADLKAQQVMNLFSGAPIKKLFAHLCEQHDLVLTETEKNDILYILLWDKEYLRQANDVNSSDTELQRIQDWLMDKDREPAQTKFTSGKTGHPVCHWGFDIGVHRICNK